MWAVNAYQITADQLTLHTTSGAVAVFQKQTPTDHLVGKEFQVQGLTINSGVVSSADAPVQTLRFGQDGTLSGNAGCNNFSGTYKIKGNQLQIGQVGATKMACMDEKKTQYESVFFKHLQKTPLTIEDTPNNVTLRESNGSIVMVFSPK
jgi:heat shock protein HslJ